MLTREQWAEVEKDLSIPYGHVKLRCDDHDITAAVERGKGLRYLVVVYIDGYVHSEHMKGEPQHVRKFWRERAYFAWPAKQRTEAAAQLKKRGIGKEYREFLQRVATASNTMWDPCWPNAAALCRHLRKTCTAIERIHAEV